VTAPPEMLAARLEERARRSDGDVADRMSRVVTVEGALNPDFTIENAGTVQQATRRLLNVIFG